jgi:molybdenum cofactor cytidylyltransferase
MLATTPISAFASISLVLLAAGESSRMNGANKMLAKLGKQSMLATTLDVYAGVGFGELLVVTGREREEIAAIAKNIGAKTVFNPEYRSGMASSLVKGLGKIRPQAAGILVALGDMPFIEQASIEELCRTFLQKNSPTAICLPTCEGKRGNPVLFGIAHKQAMMRLSGDIGAKSIVQNNAQHCVEIPLVNKGCLFDVDTHEELEDARSISLVQHWHENDVP